MRSTVRTEFTGDGIVEIAPRKALGFSFGVAEARLGESHHVIGTAAGYVLAFATMALALEECVAVDLVTQVAAITSTFEFHLILL